MKTNRRLTDEELARLIESDAGLEAIQFDGIDSLEACTVASNALALMEDCALSELDSPAASAMITADMSEPLAMCGFLGDQIDDQDDEEEDENVTDTDDSES